MNKQEKTSQFTREDIEENSFISGLAYIIFFLPLVVRYDSLYGRFHANQSILLLLAYAAGNLVLRIIPGVGWILLLIYSIFFLLLSGVCMVYAFMGKSKELPIIGKYRIVKKPFSFLKDNFNDVLINDMVSNEV